MCRIDEPFGSHSLEEKTDPTERFLQALDECGAEGDFRQLLEKHFSLSWCRDLGPIEAIEAALKAANCNSDLPDKTKFFVQAINRHSNEKLQIFFPGENHWSLAKKHLPERFSFAKAVASQVFPDSIYGFYECFKGLYSSPFEDFVLGLAPFYYGDSCHLKNLLFRDRRLVELGDDERESLLWAIYLRLVQGDDSFRRALRNAFSWHAHASVPTLATIRIDQAFEYACAWIQAEANSCNHSESHDLFCKFRNDLHTRINHVWSENFGALGTTGELESFKIWVEKWHTNKDQDLQKAWCLGVVPEGMSPEILNDWASHAEQIFLPLSSDLNKAQAEALIAFHIKEDLKKWVKPDRFPQPILEADFHSKLWYVSAFRESWRRQLVSNLEALTFGDRLRVLRRRLGLDVVIFPDRLPDFLTLPEKNLTTDHKRVHTGPLFIFPVDETDSVWWDSLLRNLSEEDSFPKDLYSLWVIEVLDRFGFSEILAPLADKSLGLIRGDLEADNNRLSGEQLRPLFSILRKYAPEKALRHSLMLLRVSRSPFAKETLDIDRESLCPWSMSEILSEFWGDRIEQLKKHHISNDEWTKEEIQFLTDFRRWFSDYCISRLRLRKGEKAEGDSYMADQVVEKSSLWRQAYLKALAEVGVDQQGQVHKTVYFTRNYDPDEAVRSVAKECYKAVRREKNKSQAAADIRRGLAAAYWWLLLAQRQELGLPINYEEARLTRRRLLRR
ncbi:hypothetical protein [Geoalkalibacter halelectricus]|uniref:hypothetical protein n=1 Tax=Geoalkalibacter halelectricus TaxID=2847045 RepID=UPI0026707394|nr:hypothetical protein [Geoalkalibacter halelectricus]MDO3380483.1 hypothetical protein [Geoalkalibacter halelectricus]